MTIFGWDASHYDTPQVASAVADGITFITHKAGGDALDAELDDWWANARGLDPAKVLLGAYWVLYPDRPVSRADAFLARLDAVCAGWRQRPFILQVDCEKWNGNPDTVPSLAEIRAFCDRLVERTGGKYRPIVYAPKWVYGDRLKGLPYPLWASSYVSAAGPYRGLYPGDSSARWGAYSGQVPAILQYSSSATIGNQTTCDINAFRGTLSQLTALVTPQEDDHMDRAEFLGHFRAAMDDPAIRADLQRVAWEFRPAELDGKKTAHAIVLQDVPRSLAGLTTSLAGVAGRVDISADEVQAVAAALAPAIVAQLPKSGTVTDEQLEAALRAVLGSVDNTQQG